MLLTNSPAVQGVLVNMAPSVNDWYSATLAMYEPLVADVLRYAIPIGFAVVFGIILQVVLSILFYLIRKPFRRSKKVKPAVVVAG